MNRYLIGQTVRIGGVDRDYGREKDLVNRIAVTRPDGTIVTKDWDQRALKLKVDQPGTWIWEATVREDGLSREESGQFEVIAAAH